MTIVAPIDSVAILAIQRTLIREFSTGLATDSGGSTTNLLYTVAVTCGSNELTLGLKQQRHLAMPLAIGLLILSALMF